MAKERFGKHISLIYRYSQIFFNDKLKKYHLGSGQYIFLLSVLENKGINQEQLSQIVKIDKTTTARAIAKLCDEGYILRQRDTHDKRAYNLFPTAKAEAIAETLENILDEWNNIILEKLSARDCSALLGLLAKIDQNILAKTEPHKKASVS